VRSKIRGGPLPPNTRFVAIKQESKGEKLEPNYTVEEGKARRRGAYGEGGNWATDFP